MADIGRKDWDRLISSNTSKNCINPFIQYDFLSSLEASGSVGSGSGWQPRHVSVRQDGRLVAAAPCYLKAHSQGEYVFDHGWADAFERAGGAYYPKLQIAMPFTPATGPRLLVAGSAPLTRLDLAATLARLPEALGVSSLHATFLDEDDRGSFELAGLLMRSDIQFHFFNRGYRDRADFDATFASRKRKQMRKEREAALATGLTLRRLTGTDLTEEVWDSFFSFYMDTGGRKWGRPYLNRRFFSLIGETMSDRILLVGAERNGRLIAGALNFIGGDALYGRYWGAIEEHPFLHFELCYHQAIDFAIEHGLDRVEAGAQGEHKLARGYEPVITHSAHAMAHEGLRDAVADYLKRERAAIRQEAALLREHLPFRPPSMP